MNPIDYRLDVLANSPTEINQITKKLHEGGYTVVCNLGYSHPSVNKSREFQSGGYGSPDVAPALLVSEEFPRAIFLLTYVDMQWSYSGKCVICGGRVIRHIHDGEQRAQAQDWALLDIFAPFRAEYETDSEVGSLWQQWLDDIIAAANELKERSRDAGLSVEKFQDAVNVQEEATRAVRKLLGTDSGEWLR
jgi:hypothetical protein